MTDDNPASKWRAAGQQHPAAPDPTRNDTRCQVSADLVISRGCGRAGGQVSRELANPQVVMTDSATSGTEVVLAARNWPHELRKAAGWPVSGQLANSRSAA